MASGDESKWLICSEFGSWVPYCGGNRRGVRIQLMITDRSIGFLAGIDSISGRQIGELRFRLR